MKVEKNKKPASERKYNARERQCLMCGDAFMSTWPGERICSSCKQTSAWNNSSLAA